MITQVHTAALSKVDGAYSMSSERAKFNNQMRAFAEMFQNDVNLNKLGQSVPHLNSYVECFANMNGTSLSKTDHLVFLLDLFLKQHDSLIPSESFEQFLKEGGHWIPKSILSDAEVQEKVCDKQDKIKTIGVPVKKRSTENEKNSAELDHLKISDVKDGMEAAPVVFVEPESVYNVQMDEKKLPEEVGVVEMAHAVTSNQMVAASIAGNVAEVPLCVKEANESRSTLEKPNKQKLANYIDILFSCVILHEIIIFLQMSQNLLHAGVYFLTYIQPAEHVFKMLFCQAKEVTTKEIVGCTIVTHCEDHDAVQRSIHGDEVVSHKLLSVMSLMVNENPRKGAKADHSNGKETENFEHDVGVGPPGATGITGQTGHKGGTGRTRSPEPVGFPGHPEHAGTSGSAGFTGSIDKQKQRPLSNTNSGGKNCSTVGWLFLIVCLHFSSTLATSKSCDVNVTFNEPFSLQCNVSDSAIFFRLKRYLKSPNIPEDLYDSRNTKLEENITYIRALNDANITVSRNGTMTCESAKFSDTGEYHCLVYSNTTKEQTTNYVCVQNSTVNVNDVKALKNNTDSNVTVAENLPESNLGAVIGSVVGGLAIIAVVAGLISYCVYTRRKRKANDIQRQQAPNNDNQRGNNRNSIENGVPNRVSIRLEATRQSNDTTAEPLMNGMHNSISVGHEAIRQSNGHRSV